MKQSEELPLLTTRSANDATIEHSSQGPTTAQKWHVELRSPRLRGMLLVGASAITFSLLSVMVKYASQSISSMEIVFWRSFVAWLLNLAAVRASGVSLYIEKPYRLALASRCFFGFCSMSLGFYAMQQMVLADASVLIFMSPVMTFFLGALVLKEKIDAINFGCALVSFVGVVCVARPTFLFGSDHATADTDGSTLAIFCALLDAAAQAVVYVSMRRLQQVNYLVVINYFLLTGSVVSLLSLVFIQQEFMLDMSCDVWLAVLGTGLLGFLGQLFLTRGFQLESAGTASVMRYLDVAFVFIWDVTLLHERVNLWSAVGALVICGSAIAIAVRKMQNH